MSNDNSGFDVDSNSLDILDDNEDEASPHKKEPTIVEDVRKYFFDVVDSDVERKFIMRWGGITFKPTALSLLAIYGVLSLALLLLGTSPGRMYFYLTPLFFCALALLFAVVFFADKKRIELDDEKLVRRSRMYGWFWNREIPVSSIAQFHVEPFQFMRDTKVSFGVFARLKDGSDIKILTLMDQDGAKRIEAQFEKFLNITDAPVRFPAPRTMRVLKQDDSYVLRGYPRRGMTVVLGGLLVVIIATLIMFDVLAGIDEQAWKEHAQDVLFQRTLIYGVLGYLLARIMFLYITPSRITLKQDGIFVQGFGTGSKYSGRDDQEASPGILGWSWSLSGFLWTYLGIRPKRHLEATQDKHAIYYEVEHKRHWYDKHRKGENSLFQYEVVLVQSNSDQKEFVGKSMQLEQARFIAQEITLFYGLDEYDYDDKKRVQYVRSYR